MSPRPPLLARALLMLLVPAGAARNGLLGDLHEMFAERRLRDGSLSAALWYWGQAFQAAFRYASERLLDRFRQIDVRRSARSRNAGIMDTLFQDLRFALRTLLKSPVFTVVSALTIALGIGATTTVFSLVNSVLLRPPPGIQNAAELVRPHRIAEDGSTHNEWSYPSFVALQEAETGLSDLAAMTISAVGIQNDGMPETAISFFVSHNFFELVGVRPAFGRFFLPEEDNPDTGNLVAVLSYSLWNRRFGGDSSIVGSSVRMNRHTLTIVGIAQEGFLGPNAILEAGVWLPLGVAPTFDSDYDLGAHDATWLDIIGRRSPDTSNEQVETALNVVSSNLRAAYPETSVDYGVDVEQFGPIGRDALLAAAAFSVFLFAASGTILLIACVNVGGMLLSRASGRGKEMALRLALGARRARVIRQLLTESAMLFSLGGAGGLLLTYYATKLIASYQVPFDVPLVLDFAPDMRALVFSLVVAFLTGMIFGLAPALQITKPDLNTTLKGDSLASASTRSRLRSTFVVAQVAGSALLLVGAGLFARGLARARSVDLGFEPAGLHALSSELGLQGNYTDAEAAYLYGAITERASALPQVESAGLIDAPPVTLGGTSTRYAVVGREPVDEEDRLTTETARISAGLLETMRMPVVQGRAFTQADRENTPLVAIVNEHFAQREWPGETALGKRVQLHSAEEPALEIVGVVRNARYRSLSEQQRSMVYVPYEQHKTTDMVVVVRVRPGAEDIAPAMRDIVYDIEPDLLVDANTSYENFMGIAMLPSRAAAIVTAVFGILGLGMASLGLYGILAYMVGQRTREIGIRMALGAEERTVRGMVLGDGAKLAGIGLTIGFVIALAVTRLLRGLLHGLSPTDPVTFGGIALILTAVALIASYIPARRATRTDPIKALRVE
jgi:predicted permease